VISFLGHPVASGFTSGAAIIIGLSQVKYIVGYEIPRSSQVHETIGGLIDHVDGLSWITLVLGLIWIFYLIANRKLAVRYRKQLGWMLPLGPLVSSMIGILLVFAVKPLREDLEVEYVGDIPSGIFPVSVSDWKLENVPKVLPTALSATLIGFMESIAISKHLAALNGYEIEAGQELFALGVSNIAGSFFLVLPSDRKLLEICSGPPNWSKDSVLWHRHLSCDGSHPLAPHACLSLLAEIRVGCHRDHFRDSSRCLPGGDQTFPREEN